MRKNQILALAFLYIKEPINTIKSPIKFPIDKIHSIFYFLYFSIEFIKTQLSLLYLYFSNYPKGYFECNDRMK